MRLRLCLRRRKGDASARLGNGQNWAESPIMEKPKTDGASGN
jgi:hypothetical protein